MDLFFVGKLKKKFMKPSEIKPEEEKEYYCVGEVPKNGIATYDQGYFLPLETFHSIISQQSDEETIPARRVLAGGNGGW